MQKTRPPGRWIEGYSRFTLVENTIVSLAIRRKSQEPRFLEVMDSFVLLAYASLAASWTLLQRLLACLSFTLDSEDLFFWYKRKKWTTTAAQAAENHGDQWGLTWYDEGHIHQFQPEPIDKIPEQQQKH